MSAATGRKSLPQTVLCRRCYGWGKGKRWRQVVILHG